MKKVLAIAAVPALFVAGLLTIYYAGNNGLRVLTDTEAVVGIPITALVPEIGLAMTRPSITVSVITRKN